MKEWIDKLLIGLVSVLATVAGFLALVVWNLNMTVVKQTEISQSILNLISVNKDDIEKLEVKLESQTKSRFTKDDGLGLKKDMIQFDNTLQRQIDRNWEDIRILKQRQEKGN